MAAIAVEPDLATRRILDDYIYGVHTFVEVPVTDLHVDRKYQRKIIEAAVQRIVNGFDIDLFEPLTVNRRGWKSNEMVVIDGQHRLMAARKLGIQTVTCRVISVDKEREAHIFVLLNRQRIYLAPVSAFRAELVAGNPAAAEIKNCVEARGLSISDNNNENNVAAVTALKKIYARSGYVGLGRTLDAALLAWPPDERLRFSADILLGMHLFLSANHRVEANVLAERLATVTPRQILAKASQRWHGWKSVESGNTKSKVDCVADEIGRVYRKRR